MKPKRCIFYNKTIHYFALKRWIYLCTKFTIAPQSTVIKFIPIVNGQSWCFIFHFSCLILMGKHSTCNQLLNQDAYICVWVKALKRCFSGEYRNSAHTGRTTCLQLPTLALHSSPWPLFNTACINPVISEFHLQVL